MELLQRQGVQVHFSPGGRLTAPLVWSSHLFLLLLPEARLKGQGILHKESVTTKYEALALIIHSLHINSWIEDETKQNCMQLFACDVH